MKETMRKIIMSLMLLLVVQAAGAAIAVKPAKGSIEAAQQTAAEYLQGYYKAPKDLLGRAAILESSNDSMTLQASFRKMVCTMSMQKHASANHLGWVVKQHRCDAEFP